MTKAFERESGSEGSAPLSGEAEEVVRRQPLNNLRGEKTERQRFIHEPTAHEMGVKAVQPI